MDINTSNTVSLESQYFQEKYSNVHNALIYLRMDLTLCIWRQKKVISMLLKICCLKVLMLTRLQGYFCDIFVLYIHILLFYFLEGKHIATHRIACRSTRRCENFGCKRCRRKCAISKRLYTIVYGGTGKSRSNCCVSVAPRCESIIID